MLKLGLKLLFLVLIFCFFLIIIGIGLTVTLKKYYTKIYGCLVYLSFNKNKGG